VILNASPREGLRIRCLRRCIWRRESLANYTIPNPPHVSHVVALGIPGLGAHLFDGQIERPLFGVNLKTFAHSETYRF
jgi:hypothetical protein